MLKNIAFRHRLIGAIFVISLAIIVIPAIFDRPAVDTLAVNDAVPSAPSHEAWQDLSEIDYSFTELVGDMQAEEAIANETEVANNASSDALAPLTLADETTIVPPAEQPAQAETQAAPLLAQNTPDPAEKSAKEAQIAPSQAEDVVVATERLIAKNTWAVQLGAFSKPENAQALLKRLQEKGYAAYIEPMASKNLSRVLVGVEPSQQKAAELLTQLDNEMHLKGIVVKL